MRPTSTCDSGRGWRPQSGMRYAVLTAKHVDGFCLWPSKRTAYSVAATPARRDLVAEFVEAFAAEGLKVGLYYALLDRHCPFYEDDARYAEYVRDQVEELLTRYGEVVELWFDGAWDKDHPTRDWPHDPAWEAPTGARWEWTRLYEHIHRMQPRCLVIQNSSSDRPGRAELSSRRRAHQRALRLRVAGAACASRGSIRVFPSANGSVFLPLEYCTTLTPGWFWQAGACYSHRFGRDHRRLAAARRAAARQPPAQRRARYVGTDSGVSPLVSAGRRSSGSRRPARAAVAMRPAVIVVSHTHWDREWYQPFEVFRLRLCDMVAALLDILDGDPQFRHFMLDGQTVCLDDVLELHPSLRSRLQAHVSSGRISIGPWYVLQDEFLVGAESIVRNLSEGLRSARRFGRAMTIGYLPDAFGHIAQMPRILRGFGHRDRGGVARGRRRGAGQRMALARAERRRGLVPVSARRIRQCAPTGFRSRRRRSSDCAPIWRTCLPLSRAAMLLWMNGNDHQPAEPQVPALLAALGRALPDVDIEHASLERAAELVRERIDVAALPVVAGELRRATPTVPVLSGVWSVRSWQKRSHDRAEALLVRFAEPFVALSLPRRSSDRRDALAHAWRLLLQCQPHDSICGCSIDEVHREITTRLRRVEQIGRTLVEEAVHSLVGARTPDFALHEAIAIVNPHPFAVTATVEVELQRHTDNAPFRLVGPTRRGSLRDRLALADRRARPPTD